MEKSESGSGALPACVRRRRFVADPTKSLDADRVRDGVLHMKRPSGAGHSSRRTGRGKRAR